MNCPVLSRVPAAAGSLSLLLVFAHGGCSLREKRVSFHPEPLPAFAAASMVVVDDSGEERRIPLMDLTEHFLALATRAQNNHRQDVNEFIAAGLNVSDEITDRWFRQQYSLEAASRYHQNTANVAAGLGTALLGITDASSRAVGLLGAGVTAMNAQWRNVEAHYLISPTLPVVIDKIRAFRAEQREAILSALRTQEVNYNEAVAILRSYHQTASRETIQRFLQRSAELAQLTPADGGKSGVTEAEIGAHSTVVYALLNEDAPGFYSDRDLTALFALLTEPDDSEVLRALRDTPRYRAMADRVADVTETGRNRLIGRMLALDNLLGLESRVERLREAAAHALQDLQFGTSLSSTARTEFTQRNSAIHALLNAGRPGAYSVEQLVELYALLRPVGDSEFTARRAEVPEAAQLAEQVEIARQDENRFRALQGEIDGIDRLINLRRRMETKADAEHGLSTIDRRGTSSTGADRGALRVAEAVREALNSPVKRNLLSDWKVVPAEAR